MQNNYENKGTPHAFTGYGKAPSNQPQHPHHLQKQIRSRSDNHTTLPSEKIDLKHESDDAIPSTKPSWERHATETSDNATWLLREHQLEGVIKTRCSCVNCKKNDSSRPPTHWKFHCRRVQDEGVFIHPNTNQVSGTKEAGSWSQLTSARDPSTTKSQIGWILSYLDWSTT